MYDFVCQKTTYMLWYTFPCNCVPVYCVLESPSVCLCTSLSLFLSLIQCLCACHVTPGPATNWVSPSFSPSLLSMLTSLALLPPSPPPASLHRCLSVALSTAWSVPLSAGCMVVILKAACNQWGRGWGGGGLNLRLFFDHPQGMGGFNVSFRYWWEFTVTCLCWNADLYLWLFLR